MQKKKISKIKEKKHCNNNRINIVFNYIQKTIQKLRLESSLFLKSRKLIEKIMTVCEG